jgi:peroxiredoxin
MSGAVGRWIILVALLVPAPAVAQDPAAALGLIRPKPAQPARDFQVATLDQRSLRLSDLRGKVVFLNFWATWCKPCEAEMPSMERLWQRYRDRGLVVLAVSADADGQGAVGPFVARHKLTFPVGLDPKMEVSALYQVWALPSTFIVDRQGNRVLFANGPREWDGKASVAVFDALLR